MFGFIRMFQTILYNRQYRNILPGVRINVTCRVQVHVHVNAHAFRFYRHLSSIKPFEFLCSSDWRLKLMFHAMLTSLGIMFWNTFWQILQRDLQNLQLRWLFALVYYRPLLLCHMYNVFCAIYCVFYGCKIDNIQTKIVIIMLIYPCHLYPCITLINSTFLNWGVQGYTFLFHCA